MKNDLKKRLKKVIPACAAAAAAVIAAAVILPRFVFAEKVTVYPVKNVMASYYSDGSSGLTGQADGSRHKQ